MTFEGTFSEFLSYLENDMKNCDTEYEHKWVIALVNDLHVLWKHFERKFKFVIFENNLQVVDPKISINFNKNMSSDSYVNDFNDYLYRKNRLYWRINSGLQQS